MTLLDLETYLINSSLVRWPSTSQAVRYSNGVQLHPTYEATRLHRSISRSWTEGYRDYGRRDLLGTKVCELYSDSNSLIHVTSQKLVFRRKFQACQPQLELSNPRWFSSWTHRNSIHWHNRIVWRESGSLGEHSIWNQVSNRDFRSVLHQEPRSFSGGHWEWKIEVSRIGPKLLSDRECTDEST
jgi:hypothetical protein